MASQSTLFFSSSPELDPSLFVPATPPLEISQQGRHWAMIDVAVNQRKGTTRSRMWDPCLQQRFVDSQEEIQATKLALVAKRRLKNFPLISSSLFKCFGVFEDSNQTSSMTLLSNSVAGAKPYSTALPMRLYWSRAFPVASRTKRQV
jgi:hypothetical protein